MAHLNEELKGIGKTLAEAKGYLLIVIPEVDRVAVPESTHLALREALVEMNKAIEAVTNLRTDRSSTEPELPI